MIIKSYRDTIRVFMALCLTWTQMTAAAPTATASPEPDRGSTPRIKLDSSVPSKPKLGDLVIGVLSPDGNTVSYEGQRDLQGRARVYSWAGGNSLETPSFRFGAVDTDGKITWESTPSSTRRPGEKLWPDYAEIKGGNEIIPRSRALVPVGPVTDVERGSGQSEINSPGSEYLPEFSDENRPTRLRETLNWTREQGQDFRDSIQRVVRNASNSADINALTQKSAKLLDKIKGPTVSVFNTSASYYTALGFLAAFNLMLNYSNNPLAWDKFIQSLPWNDPVGFVSLLGFMAGAAWFYKKMGNAAPGGGVLRQTPFFVAALMAGTLVSTSVGVLAQNEDFLACTGFTAYKATGHFRWDLNACDRFKAYATASPEEMGMINEIANAFVPLAANVLAAGGIYLGAIQTVQFISNKYKIVEALRFMSPVKTATSGRGGGWVGTIIITAIHMALFLGAMQIAGSVFHIEKSVREYLIAEKGLFGNQYGSSLSEAETNLFTEWNRAKKNNWHDPNSWDKLCVDTNRPYGIFYNCDAPDQLDFIGVLGRYGKLQDAWRAVQMQETLSAYSQWAKKLNNFSEMLDMSYKFYKNALAQIQVGQFTPALLRQPPPTDNDEIKKQYMDNTWQKIFTPKMQEFLLTSMACGPELEGYTSNSWWQSTRRFLQDYVTGNSTPGTMINDTTGFKIYFYPPRITKPLPGTNDTICQRSPQLLPELITTRYDVTQFPISIDGKSYRGLQEYIKDNIRGSVISPETGSSFEDWWSKHVMTGAMAVQDDMQKQYQQVINTVYKKAVTRQDMKWCEIAGVKDTGLEKYMRRLMKPSEACGPDAMHRLSYGIFANIKDEMRLYLAMTLDIYLSNVTKIGGPIAKKDDGTPVFAESMAQYENILIPRAAQILEKYETFTSTLTVAEPAQRADIIKSYGEVRKLVDEFAELIMSGSKTATIPPRVVRSRDQVIVIPPMRPYQLTWAAALLFKTTQLIKNSENYYNVLRALDRPAAAQ